MPFRKIQIFDMNWCMWAYFLVTAVSSISALPADTKERCGNAECEVTQKCVPVARPTCNDTNCTKYPTCVSLLDETCTSDSCNSGDICIDIQTDCGRNPCPVIPRCLSTHGSLRNCEERTCENNEICVAVAGEECQDQNCPTTGTCLAADRAPCDLVWCPSGSVCMNIEKPCDEPPCVVIPRCVDNAGEKSQCGDVMCEEEEICLDLEDRNCNEDTCPVMKICYALEVEEGVCPRLTHNPPGAPCQTDSDCRFRLKCCFLDGAAAPMCTPPVTGYEKPGLCPAPNPFLFVSCSFNYLQNCVHDKECPLNYKCCNNGCDRVCRLPITVAG